MARNNSFQQRVSRGDHETQSKNRDEAIKKAAIKEREVMEDAEEKPRTLNRPRVLTYHPYCVRDWTAAAAVAEFQIRSFTTKREMLLIDK